MGKVVIHDIMLSLGSLKLHLMILVMATHLYKGSCLRYLLVTCSHHGISGEFCQHYCPLYL
jgi:hypothetical protein